VLSWGGREASAMAMTSFLRRFVTAALMAPLACETDMVVCRPAVPLSAEDTLSGRSRSVGELIDAVMIEAVPQVSWSGGAQGTGIPTSLKLSAAGEPSADTECAIDVQQGVLVEISAEQTVEGTMRGVLTLETGTDQWYLRAEERGTEWGGLDRSKLEGIEEGEGIEAFMLNGILGLDGSLLGLDLDVSVLKDDGHVVSSRKIELGRLEQ
jgi:hypothetical protein